MSEVTKEKIESAGKQMLLWRKIYNHLCRKCQHQLFRCVMNQKNQGTQMMVKASEVFIKDGLCTFCKNRVKLIMGE